MCMYVCVIVYTHSYNRGIRIDVFMCAYALDGVYTYLHACVYARVIARDMSCAWVLCGMHKCIHCSFDMCTYVLRTCVYACVYVCACACIYAASSSRVHSFFYFSLAHVLSVCDSDLGIVLCLSVLYALPPPILRLPWHVYCIIQFVCPQLFSYYCVSYLIPSSLRSILPFCAL